MRLARARAAGHRRRHGGHSARPEDVEARCRHHDRGIDFSSDYYDFLSSSVGGFHAERTAGEDIWIVEQDATTFILRSSRKEDIHIVSVEFVCSDHFHLCKMCVPGCGVVGWVWRAFG